MEQTRNVVDELQRLKPHHLVVSVEGSEEPRRVGVPAVRNRWSRVAAILDQLRWTQIDARDKAGATLAILQAPEEDDTPSVKLSGEGVTIREAELVSMLAASNDRAVQRAIEIQERTQAHMRGAMDVVLRGVAALLEQVTQATGHLGATYTEAIAVQRQLAVRGAGGDDDSMAAALAPLAAAVMGVGGGAKSDARVRKPTDGK